MPQPRRRRPKPADPHIQVANLTGLGKRIRGHIWTADADLMAHHRGEWPELWKTLDDLVAYIDELAPPWPE